MATHKNIERVCVFFTIIAILVTVLFMNGSKIGIAADDSVAMGYEDMLFDEYATAMTKNAGFGLADQIY